MKSCILLIVLNCMGFLWAATGAVNRSSTPATFVPKVTESPASEDLDEYGENAEEIEIGPSLEDQNEDDDLGFQDLFVAEAERGRYNGSHATKTPVYMVNLNNETRHVLNPLLEFVQLMLKSTSHSENIIEAKLTNKIHFDDTDDVHDEYESYEDFEYQNDYNGSANSTNLTENLIKPEPQWHEKENVCISKMVYERDSKPRFEYWIWNACIQRPERELCFTKIHAGLKGVEVHSITSCCPNFHLNFTADICEPAHTEPNLYERLKTYIRAINTTVQAHLNDTKLKTDRNKFTREINSIYTELTNAAYHIFNSTRLTVFLWDNSSMIEHVKNLLSATLNLSMSRRLEAIIETLRNHVGKTHRSTHSFFSNSMRMETLVRGQVLRLSEMQQEKKSIEFVNCREIVVKNQYFKIIDDSPHHNYQLLVHQLEPDSLLVPQSKSIFQLLNEKLSRSGKVLGNGSVSTYARIFTRCRDLVQKELAKSANSGSFTTVFMPTDVAFKELRRDQIESLWSDRICAFKFIMHNIVNEEICPSQLLRYGAEYSPRNQKADFISAPDENGTTNLYFNGQKVNTAKTYLTSNGAIYRLSSIELTGVVDFLYDIVIGFRRRFATQFIDSLSSSWLEELKNESRNVTLFMPFESVTSKNDSTLNNSSYPISIRDYLVKPRLTFYDLNNGDLISSLSGRQFLISVYPFESTLSSIIVMIIPRRHLERKAINCQQLEMPDMGACNAQLIVFKSELNRIPELNSESFLEFISNESDLSIFNSLVQFCGLECKNLLTNLTESSRNISSRGHTVLIPVNDYFNRAFINFHKFSANIELFKKTIKANTFTGTYCGFYFKNDAALSNTLGRKIRTRKILSKIVAENVYLSKNGLIAHKTNIF